MPYEVDVLREPAREAAVHRFQADLTRLDQQMGPAFEQVARFLGSHQVAITGPALGFYEIRPDGMDAAVGFEVGDPFQGDGDVERFVVPAADTVSTTHVGPYTGLTAAYDALRAHAAGIGRALDEHHMWEEYLSGPESPEAETRTRVVWPLQPA